MQKYHETMKTESFHRFEKHRFSKPLLIIGIDPGTTLGYAVLDINGKLIKISSSKILNLNSLISKIIEIGKPLIIGTDVSPAPSFVEKFAIKTGSRLIEPEQDLLIKEKAGFIKGFKIDNIHQKDALASALYAYRVSKPLLDKTDKFLKRIGKLKLSSQVKEVVIKKNMPITEAIKLVEHPEKQKPRIIEKIIEKKIFSKDVIKLKEQLKKTEKEIKLLNQQNQKLRQKAESLERRTKLPEKIEKIDEKLSMKQRIINILNNESTK